MFRLGLVCTALFSAGIAFASVPYNQYDALVLDCIDYGHSPVSSEEYQVCKESAADQVLQIADVRAKYLDCIDYGHSEISEERNELCLREASRY